MATSDQIKTLIKSHFENDSNRYSTVALQIAAHEARQGHLAIADDIKKLVDNSNTIGWKPIVFDLKRPPFI